MANSERSIYLIVYVLIYVIYLNVLNVFSFVYDNELNLETSSENDKLSDAWFMDNKPWLNTRLQKYIVPIRYDLLLHLMLHLDTFTGSLNLTIEVSQNTYHLVLHAKELNIVQVSIYDLEMRTNIKMKRTFLYLQHDYFILEAKDEITPGKYVIEFNFHGNYSSGIGLRKTFYINTKNEKRIFLSTFFSPHYARNVFPCFDEPFFKSVFEVSVIHDSSYFALSNSLVHSIEVLPLNLKLTRFERSLPMSTYVLGIIICDFKYIETTTETGVRIRTYANDKNIERVETSLMWASRIFKFYEKLLQFPYPLKKLDIIAVSSVIEIGLENWGLIILDELYLYIDSSSTLHEKVEKSSIIAHEISHMWFGDLVTMDWWNETWLNEGFATYLELKGAAQVLPECFVDNDQGISFIYYAMKNDARFYSNPIILQDSNNVLENAYNYFIYYKGSFLLRMLEYFMGERDFIQGIINYLRKYAYGSVKTKYLWDELLAASKKHLNITYIMDPWLKLKNYPYITFTPIADTNNCYYILQHRYNIDSNFSDNSYDSFSWNIPLTYRTADSKSPNFMLLDKSLKDNIICYRSDWLKFNVDFSGYYAVNYREQEWEKFIEILKSDHRRFGPTDRVNLIYDAFKMASDGLLSYSIAFNMSRYLTNETYHLPWTIAIIYFNNLKARNFENRSIKFIIEKYIRNLSNSLYNKLGWKDVGDCQEKMLRKQIIIAACESNNNHCLRTAIKLFKKWMNGYSLDSEIADVVYQNSLKQPNNEDLFNYMWIRYLEEQNPLLKYKYEVSLSYTRELTLVERLLSYIVDGNYFKHLNQVKLLKKMAQIYEISPIISSYIFTKWQQMNSKYGAVETENIANIVFSKFQSYKDLKKVQEFYKNHPSSEAINAIRVITLQTIRENIAWLKNRQMEVANWFESNV